MDRPYGYRLRMLSKWHVISAVLKIGDKPMKTYLISLAKRCKLKNDLTYVGYNNLKKIYKEKKDLQGLVLGRVWEIGTLHTVDEINWWKLFEGTFAYAEAETLIL